uniref:Uncharacterized protein n=1 Tax=Plectus sambesii TaxID=2011161 RepID=A0A914VF90_9BILA
MPNKTGALGLHCAAAMGHTEVVKTLIAKGTPVDIKTKENYTALHVAVQSGKADVVETLLGHGADVHVQGGPLGETALHIASGLTGPDARACAEMLLKSGAEANVPQSNGETALHIAARFGRPDMIRLLLSEEANPMATSETGETTLHVAAKNCNFEAAQIIIKYVEEHGGQAAVKRLVNSRNTEGLTSLHYAAEIRPDQLHHSGE